MASGVKLLGAARLRKELNGISTRAQSGAEGMAPLVFPVLEEAETLLFDGYRGKYVKTGAVRESLTQPTGNGAIREAHGTDLLFGSSVWYARFLTRKVGPDLGKRGKPRGRRRAGTNAVLRFPKRLREAVAEKVLHEVVYGGGR